MTRERFAPELMWLRMVCPICGATIGWARTAMAGLELADAHECPISAVSSNGDTDA